MRILQTIAGFGAKCGGTSTCTYNLLAAMHRDESSKTEVDLLTVEVSNDSDSLMGCGEEWIKAVPNDCRTHYGISRNMSRWLKLSDYDVYHTNGLWMHINHKTCAVARRKGRPYIITPHGMLYPEALHRSFWKKWPLIQLFFKKDILRADCLHATCTREMEEIRRFGYKGPVAVIANPTEMPDYIDSIAKGREAAFLGCNRPKSLGFLGRLHPIKQVENLLYGVALLGDRVQEVELEIMGKGDDRYEQFLRDEAARLGIEDRVSFVGFVSGAEKYHRIADLACLFMPSDMENFGMIVTEALSVGTPVMASLGTPWQELNEHKCGWWVDSSPESIAAVMEQALTMPLDELAAMGARGRRLVKEKYSDTEVASAMSELYRWLAGEAPRPEFVHVD